jgi:hypothetical protein
MYARLEPFVKLGLRYRSRQAFRAYLTDTYPLVQEILLNLRDGTAEIFPILTHEVLARSRASIASGALTPEEIKKVEGYQRLLADWVIMMDATLVAFDRVKGAVDAPRTIVGAVSTLNIVAIDLTAASSSARKNLAALAAE